MRPSALPTRRAATYLCATCRKQLLSRPIPLAAFQHQTSPATKPLSRQFSQTPPLFSQSSTNTPPSPPPSKQKPSDHKHPAPLYYTLFPQTLSSGPPPAGPFEIDIPTLRREFLRLQASSHPDFHHSSSSTAAARRRAEGVSALLNNAFKTLSSPLLRAQYLLKELYGVDLEADEHGREAEADPDVLMTVMEAREVIEEAGREEDLEEVRGINEERIRETVEEIARGFAAGDVEAVKTATVRLRYWMGIREGVDNWEKGGVVHLQH